jgi:hypothetical protein
LDEIEGKPEEKPRRHDDENSAGKTPIAIVLRLIFHGAPQILPIEVESSPFKY